LDQFKPKIFRRGQGRVSVFQREGTVLVFEQAYVLAFGKDCCDACMSPTEASVRVIHLKEVKRIGSVILTTKNNPVVSPH
jgi:hypothetical protein